MTAADLAAVATLEAACHAPLPPEGEPLFAERLALFPEACLVTEDDGGLAGYLVAHPWAGEAPPRLGQRLLALPAAADRLHLHDIALAPRARGRGLVAESLALLALLAAARRLVLLSLVAAHGTAPFWARHGFVASAAPAEGYGNATAMLRRA